MRALTLLRRHGVLISTHITPAQREELGDLLAAGAVTISRADDTRFGVMIYQITDKGYEFRKAAGNPEPVENPFKTHTVAALQRMRKTMSRDLKLIEELIGS